eukprot:symbB.v1.2.030060.t1/scaffold3347.1/size58713/7
MTIASNYAVAEEVVPLFLGDLRSSESNRLEIGKLDVDVLIFDISLWALQHVKVCKQQVVHGAVHSSRGTMFGCCTCERANRAEAVAKVAPAPSGAAAGGRQGQTGKRRSVKAAAFEEPPQTDSKDGPGPAAILPSAKDPVQVEPEDANLNTRPPSADGQDGQSGQALQATQAREHEVTELTEAPKRTRRRSHFVPSDAAAAAAEAASPLTAASAEPGTGQLQTLVEDPTSGFQGTHKACLLGVTKTVHGSTPLVESEFKEKFVEHSGCDSEAAARSRLQKAGVTISCAKGRKAGTPNQDRGGLRRLQRASSHLHRYFGEVCRVTI